MNNSEKSYNLWKTEGSASAQSDWSGVLWRLDKAGWLSTGGSTRGIIKQPVGSPWEECGVHPKLGFPSLEHQSPKSSQITTSSEKQQGRSLIETLSWRLKEPFKEPTHKFPFVAIYPGLQQRWGQSGLEKPEERLGMEALGRELRE